MTGLTARQGRSQRWGDEGVRKEARVQHLGDRHQSRQPRARRHLDLSRSLDRALRLRSSHSRSAPDGSCDRPLPTAYRSYVDRPVSPPCRSPVAARNITPDQPIITGADCTSPRQRGDSPQGRGRNWCASSLRPQCRFGVQGVEATQNYQTPRARARSSGRPTSCQSPTARQAMTRSSRSRQRSISSVIGTLRLLGISAISAGSTA